MNTYPNQKIITIKKAESNKDNIYGIINKDCMYEAMKDLTYNEFKIYMYCVTNQNNYEFALSTKDISEKTNASVRKLQEAVNGLIKKKYLVPVEEKSNKYILLEDKNSIRTNSTEYAYEKYVGMCTKGTGYTYKKDVEILQDNTNIIHNNTDVANAPFSPDGEPLNRKSLDDNSFNESENSSTKGNVRKDATNLYFAIKAKDSHMFEYLLNQCDLGRDTRKWGDDDCADFINMFYITCPDLLEESAEQHENNMNRTSYIEDNLSNNKFVPCECEDFELPFS